MDSSRFPVDIGRRFHRPTAPTIFACADLCDPIAFSHVSSDAAMPAPTLAPRVENAFAIHVHHAPLSRGDIWIQGRHIKLPRVRDGGIFIFDLRTEPVAQLHERFEFSRFQLSRSSMDDLAYERGLRKLGDLRADTCDPDPVIQHLASALIQHTGVAGDKPDTLFSDSIALALFAHVARKYGGAFAAPRAVGVLAPWQIRRLNDWVDSHLGESMSIGSLAALVRLSPSYFARAFAKSFGVSPHRWLLQRRIERAKEKMKGSNASLGEIAAACGFADQSHFTHVFSNVVGQTPKNWRRILR
jgi:AraC family transcriptional regulator